MLQSKLAKKCCKDTRPEHTQIAAFLYSFFVVTLRSVLVNASDLNLSLTSISNYD